MPARKPTKSRATRHVEVAVEYSADVMFHSQSILSGLGICRITNVALHFGQRTG